MEEYSDLKFDGDLSFLNENLDAAKYAEKEALIKKEIIKEESTKSAREEFERQERIREEAKKLAKAEFERKILEKDILKSTQEEIELLAIIELEKLEREQETKKLATIEAKKMELENDNEKADQKKESKRLAKIEAERFAEVEAERLEQEEAQRLAAIEAERFAEVEAERLEQEETDRLAAIEAERIQEEQETEKLAEIESEKSNETVNAEANNSVNENEVSFSNPVKQEIITHSFSPSNEKKSQLEEMILNSDYGVEMFNNLKMELLELEREKIIMKYKQDLMMMIIKS